MKTVRLASLLLPGVGLLSMAGDDVQAQAARVARPAAVHCAAAANLRLPDARILEVKAVPGIDSAPDAIRMSHCRVSGVIGREIRFTVWLPDHWNERFFMGGGGGFVGSVQNQALATLNQGYATTGTDTGHQALGMLAGWALDDVERQLNYGHVAVHRTAEVAKAIIRAYYGSEPRYSYFSGCSNGGRQALMAAQRYPEDFDGIVSGAPAFDFTHIAAAFIRNTQTVYPDPAAVSNPAITLDNLKLLEAGVLEACDARDGVTDGVLDDPRECGFRVADLRACPGDVPAADCITTAQRRAIERVYSPTVGSTGPIYPGQPFGGESDPGGWPLWITGPSQQLLAATGGRASSAQAAFGTEFFKYLVFGDSTWDYSRYDFATWQRDTRLAASILNADDPNLDVLRARQRKLILWHGWSDAALNAFSTIDYYGRAEARDRQLRDYARLFLLPGVLHCAGGPGPDTVDWASAISDWVERGRAPTRVIAAKLGKDGQPARTRPLCPYPERARYRGAGSQNDEASYSCSAR